MSSCLLNTLFEYLIDTSKVTSPNLNSCFPSQIYFTQISKSVFPVRQKILESSLVSFFLILHPSANSFSLIFKIYLEYLESNAFSLSPLLLFWSRPSSFLAWINCYSFPKGLPASILPSLWFILNMTGWSFSNERSYYSLDFHYSDLWNG